MFWDSRFLINGKTTKSQFLDSSKSPGAKLIKIPWNCLTSTDTYQKSIKTFLHFKDGIWSRILVGTYTAQFFTDPGIRSRIPICLLILSLSKQLLRRTVYANPVLDSTNFIQNLLQQCFGSIKIWYRFDMDTDPRIRTTALRIWIHTLILLFSSVAFKMPTKKSFFLEFFFATIRNLDSLQRSQVT